MTDYRITDEIRNKKVMVVEGKDDVGFFVKMLDKLNIFGVYVASLGGKDKFNDDLPDLQKRPAFSDITHFGVIRDQDIDNAFESVANILSRKMGFKNIPSENGQFVSGTPLIGIFIMPGNSIRGKTLEDLCLKTVEDHPAMQCVNEFASCASALENKPKNMAKAKAQTFLAAQPEIVNSVGLGAEKNYWDFDSPSLNELKQFLNNLK